MSNERTAFDDSSWFKDWFIGKFKTWPKLHFGDDLNARLTVFKGSIKFKVTRLYGLSFRGGVVGFMKLERIP